MELLCKVLKHSVKHNRCWSNSPLSLRSFQSGWVCQFLPVPARETWTNSWNVEKGLPGVIARTLCSNPSRPSLIITTATTNRRTACCVISLYFIGKNRRFHFYRLMEVSSNFSTWYHRSSRLHHGDVENEHTEYIGLSRHLLSSQEDTSYRDWLCWNPASTPLHWSLFLYRARTTVGLGYIC